MKESREFDIEFNEVSINVEIVDEVDIKNFDRGLYSNSDMTPSKSVPLLIHSPKESADNFNASAPSIPQHTY